MEQNQLVPYAELEKMAQAVVVSKLFGMQTTEQAIALMMIANAEGRHPASAAMDYHIIQGRPSLRAETLLARFQIAGGKVEWHKLSDTEAEATFTHPSGGSVRIGWDLTRAGKAGLSGKDNWKKYPRQMLRSRVVSEGVTTVYPAVKGGFYTPEEIEDDILVPELKPPAVETQAEVVKTEVKPSPQQPPASLVQTEPSRQKRKRENQAAADAEKKPAVAEAPAPTMQPPAGSAPIDDDLFDD